MKIKYFVPVLFCLFSLISFGQEKPVLINSSDQIQKGLEYYEDQKYEEALKEYSMVPENDTSYYEAAVEQVLTYYKLEKYEEGIALGKKIMGMNIFKGPELYINMGVCYDNLERYNEAIALYDEAIKIYPKNNLFEFNKAYSLTKLEKFSEAFECYKRSAQLNCFHPGTHYALGLFAMNEGKTSLAMLALSTYILLSPNSQQANNALFLINEMGTTKYEEDISSKGIDVTDGDDFSDIDMLIKNYVALNKKYKVPSKLNYNFIKQEFLLFDKLPENTENKGFWYNTYVPFYKRLLKDKKFDLFATYLLQASTNELHKSVVEKNKAKLVSFIDWIKTNWDNLHRQYVMEFNGKVQKVDVFRENKRFAISSVGTLNAGKTDYIGYTEYYNGYGRLKAQGSFVDNFKKDGEWTYYHDNGNIKGKATYATGELLTNDEYSLLGILESHMAFINGKINGEVDVYTIEGAKDKLALFTNDIMDGVYEEYFKNGQLAFRATNRNGKLQGPATSYYDNGELRKKMNFVEGDKDGEELSYYRNGKLMQKANYVKGLLNGDYVSYYDNGKISDSVKYINGNPVGKNVAYFNDGVISVTADFDEGGKLNGIRKEYDTDGKIYNEREFRKGEIIGYKYYNKKGEVIKEDNKKSGTFNFEGFYSTGMKSSIGKYGKEDKQGEWTYFDKNGNLESVSNFKDGKLEGETRIYFPNGKLKKIVMYKDDLAEGYYVEYFKNGNIASHGNYKNDELEGYWVSYYPDKTIESEDFYVDGLSNGVQKKYVTNGKIRSTETYFEGVLLSSMNYDTLGIITDSITYTKASGNRIYHFTKGGPLMSEIKVLYNNFDGEYISYYPNGKICVKGQFFNGNKNGLWTWYNWNGTINSKGNYSYGDEDGKWEWYTEDGNLERMVEYKDGKLNGKYIIYYDNGKIEYEGYNVDGLNEGFSNYYSYDGQLEHKRFYLHDQLLYYTYFDVNGKEKAINVDNETAEIKIYNKNGKLARHFNVVKGLYQGEYKRYYPSGQLYETTNYVDGDITGENIYYYPNGQAKEKKNYSYGDLDGIMLNYYADGKLKESKYYFAGDLHGKCCKYDKNGKLLKVLTYYDDQIIDISDK